MNVTKASDEVMIVSNRKVIKELLVTLFICTIALYPALFTNSESTPEYVGKILFAIVFFWIGIVNIGDSDGEFRSVPELTLFSDNPQ